MTYERLSHALLLKPQGTLMKHILLSEAQRSDVPIWEVTRSGSNLGHLSQTLFAFYDTWLLLTSSNSRQMPLLPESKGTDVLYAVHSMSF